MLTKRRNGPRDRSADFCQYDLFLQGVKTGPPIVEAPGPILPAPFAAPVPVRQSAEDRRHDRRRRSWRASAVSPPRHRAIGGPRWIKRTCDHSTHTWAMNLRCKAARLSSGILGCAGGAPQPGAGMPGNSMRRGLRSVFGNSLFQQSQKGSGRARGNVGPGCGLPAGGIDGQAGASAGRCDGSGLLPSALRPGPQAAPRKPSMN